MKDGIVIVGGSAGALIADEIFSTQYKKVFFLETYSDKIDRKKIVADKIEKGTSFIKKNNLDYFIATGDNTMRRNNFDLIHSKISQNPVNCIHERAFISKSSKIGFGNLICANSVINTHAKVGNNTVINTAAVVEHDCEIGDYAQISPNVTLCGYVTIGKYAFIGAGSVVIPKITISKDTVVAAGSCVISDLKGKKLFAGVPAVFKKDL